MKEIEIVQVSDDNLIAAVVTLAHSIWREHYAPIIGKDQVEYMLEKFQSRGAISHQIKNEGYLYYLLRDMHGNWLGYVGVIPRENELFLSKLYITAKNRGKGYGKYAVEFIETIARDKNLPKISLTVNKHNTDSIKAYEKSGFTTTGSLVTDIGGGFVMDDYRMEKTVVI